MASPFFAVLIASPLVRQNAQPGQQKTQNFCAETQQANSRKGVDKSPEWRYTVYRNQREEKTKNDDCSGNDARA